ncbi:hypothetical protein GRF29_1536g580394 [Pseudopithomyces chartarum]|uniref:Uncharacterized protein n=1 Tax=Pseudopithomyces chartarum TaxID=1892770 RepID=A0AAN6RBC7_9PLEO|nr:hypothetical protein GRF29_1536g580394 [Pseudopithomyces chartarum]
MAATETKPTLSALKTPVSATYPSELRSPMVFSATTPTFATLRREDIKTPITPPTAYLDFLKTLSPVLMSPLSTGTSTTFKFEGNRPTSMASVTSSASTGSYTSTSGPADKDKTATSTPATSRASSCSNCDHIKQEPTEPTGPTSEPPKTAPLPKEQPKEQTVTIPPPSPFRRPSSARTPRLYIPQSPYHSPATMRSPASANSANSAKSPYSAVSPRTWDEKKSSRTRRVSVREVVTRTVTYSSTPVDAKAPSFPQIDPAPRGKRRRLE